MVPSRTTEVAAMPEFHARVAFRSQLNRGPICVNVMHFSAAQLTSPFDPTTTATDIDARLTTEYRAMLTTVDTLLDITVTDMGDDPGGPLQYVLVKNVAGTRPTGDGFLDAAECAMISLSTAVPKRYARGRLFCPPAFNSTALAAGGTFAPANAYWLACVAFAAKLHSSWTVGANTYTPGIWSQTRFAGGFTPFFFATTGAIVKNQQHWLRSRAGSRP
jgi:hypothetical protein